MNIYTNKTFKGHYPVGTAAVVVATSSRAAAAALERELVNHGLPQTINPESMIELKPTKNSVRVLNDGNY